MKKNKWTDKASNLLKSELVKQGADYNILALRLKAIGIDESYSSLANKISRGSFTLAFFLQCMEVLEIKEVRI
jgi:hypothetical protein